MNPASRWRVDAARRLAEPYAGRPGVEMVVLGGSAAVGVADHASDVDLLVWWEDAVDVDWLGEPPIAVGGAERFTWQSVADPRVHLEQYRVGALKVDVGHLPRAWWDDVVTAALERHETDAGTQEMLGGFLDAVVLHGEEAYAAERARVAAYPPELARATIERHLAFGPLVAGQEHGLERGELLSFYDTLVSSVRNVLGILAGLNRVYLSTEKPKHVALSLSRMPLQPPETARRVDRVLGGPREEASAELARLVDETLSLVEEHEPDVDTTTARYVFGYRIVPCAGPPPGLA